MKVDIEINGRLRVIAETEAEAFALRTWTENATKYDGEFDEYNLKAGYLSLETPNGEDILDMVHDPEPY